MCIIDDNTRARIAAVKPARNSRSQLHRWFEENHDWFVEQYPDGDLHDWDTLTVEFTARGLVTAAGKPYKPHSARFVWWKVRREVAAKRAATQRKAA